MTKMKPGPKPLPAGMVRNRRVTFNLTEAEKEFADAQKPGWFYKLIAKMMEGKS